MPLLLSAVEPGSNQRFISEPIDDVREIFASVDGCSDAIGSVAAVSMSRSGWPGTVTFQSARARGMIVVAASL